MTRLLHRLGAWCAAHPLAVIALWLVAATVAVSLAATVGGRLSQGGQTVPGTEVHAAEARLATHFPAAAETTAVVVLHGTDRAVVAAASHEVANGIRRVAHVTPPSGHRSAVFGSWEIGDFVLLRVKRGGKKLPVQRLRITGWSIKVDDTGLSETITPTLETVPEFVFPLDA